MPKATASSSEPTTMADAASAGSPVRTSARTSGASAKKSTSATVIGTKTGLPT